MHSLCDEILNDVHLTLAGSPVHGAVSLVVDQAKIGALGRQDLEDFQLPQTGGDVDGAFTVLVRLEGKRLEE